MSRICGFVYLIGLLSAGFVFAEDAGTELRQAVEAADVAKVRTLIEKGVDVNARSESGVTALHIAAWSEKMEMIELLLNSGGKASIDVRETDYNGTPLEWATFKGSTKVVKVLLDNGSKVYDLDWSIAGKFAKDGPPPFLKDRTKETYREIQVLFSKAGFHDRKDLFSACERGDLKLAKEILDQDPSAADAVTPPGDEFGDATSVLFFAAGRPNCQVLELVLTYKPEVQKLDPSGNTPLHAAAAAGAWENVAILLDAGAAIDVANKEGETPVGAAIRKKRWLTAEILMQRGAKMPDKLPKKLAQTANLPPLTLGIKN